MDKPLISLITVVRNGAATVERTLASVAAQAYPNIEYLVLDGASTDGTQAIIERYRSHIHYYHSRPDKGAYDATEQAYRLAKGDIIGLIHADDWLSPDACATLACLASEHPTAQMFTFGMQEHWENGSPSRLFVDPPAARFTFPAALYCHGVNRFYKRELLAKYGTFDLRYPQLGDREFYVRLGLQEIPVAGTEKVLYHFAVHQGSNSMSSDPKKTAQMLEETMRMADDLLDKPMTREQQYHVESWLWFNAVRASAFCFRSGTPLRGVKLIFRALYRVPFTPLKNPFFWRIPAQLKAKTA